MSWLHSNSPGLSPSRCVNFNCNGYEFLLIDWSFPLGWLMNIIPDDSRVLWRALLGRMEVKWSSVGASTFLLAWLTAQSMGLWKEHPVMLSAVAEWWSGQITQLWASFRCQCFKCRVYCCDLQFPVSHTQPGAEVSTQAGFWKLVESVDS